MLMDYCNGFDLSVLLKTRKRIPQDEARLVIRKMVHGIKDIWKLNIIHRDMKLANILLHFPDNPELGGMNKLEKRAWLSKLNLKDHKFEAKISDFGLSTILDSTTQQLSICGTPLYSSPQLLKKRGYSSKVDTWAIGVMLYELLMGVTPFHAYEMKDLINKINDGKYMLKLEEPITIECALFLSQCLQTNESDRLNMEQLIEHPFINDVSDNLTNLDVSQYYKDLETSKNYKVILSEAQTEDTTQLLFSTKGKDNWNPLFSQLISAQEDSAVDANSLAISYKTLTM